MAEAEFSRVFSSKLKAAGYLVQRVESHGTGVGIPDMFVQGHGTDFWIELKVLNKIWAPYKQYKIPWRPGQQAWAAQYYRLHGFRKCTLTVVRFDNIITVVPMRRYFEGSTCELIPFSTDYIQELTLRYNSPEDTVVEGITFREWTERLGKDEAWFDRNCPENLKAFYNMDGPLQEDVAHIILANL